MVSAATWEPVGPDFIRDRWGRPQIMGEDGKRTAYTRATTFVGAVEDLWNVHQWERRMVALGLASRPDLVLAVNAHRNDKTRLNQICDQAKEVAGSSAAATRGTAIHAFTELIDSGRELPPGIDSETMRCLDAYRAAMAPFKILGIEEHLVQDLFAVAGTTDRIISYRGQRYIADLKTGSTVELGTGKIAGQLAMYAHSRPYDVVEERRLDHHDASALWGLVIHLPAERPGEINLHWIDLAAGWEWCKVARSVRNERAIKFGQWTKPFDPEAKPEPSVVQARRDAKAERAAREAQIERDAIAKMIGASDTPDLVRGLWKRYEAIWTDDLTELAKARIAQISREMGGAA